MSEYINEIKQLIKTGEQENIALAEQLCVGQGLDFIRLATPFVISAIHEQEKPHLAYVLFEAMHQYHPQCRNYLKRKLLNLYNSSENLEQVAKWHGQNSKALRHKSYVEINDISSAYMAYISCLIDSCRALSDQLGNWNDFPLDESDVIDSFK
ncbi:MAG: hypothetical protein HRU05_00950 [Oceanospirillaceae bacterium]|uniref:hypothetical protein n=1 Tax=Gilvibacter sp. TaxID=2729997 RepID=UPI0025B93D0E|nr:hypothetical protein [Gilvibacter sp.]NQX77259.1 hypothetical protein [Gilvibacter sp.]NRA19025.1 hypothetical protein [Oceanospirillaceae bacterium]